MKVPTLKLKRAAAKRMRAQAGPSEGQQASAPKRPTVWVSPPLERQGSPVELLDLTADTPSKGVRVEGETEEAQAPIEPAPVEAERGFSPEPPVGASSPPEEAPAGSPPHAEPEHAETAEGSRVGPTPRGFSLMNDGRRTKWLMSQVIQPDFQEELRNLGATRFFREAFSAFVRVTNSLVLTREAIGEGEAIIRQVQQDAEDAQTWAEAAKKALESPRTARADEIKEAESWAKAEANRLRVALNQLTEAEGAIEARNIYIAELNSAIQAAEDRARRAEEEAEHTREAERTTIASLATEREARAAEVEAAAEAKAAKAVEEFLASNRYVDELAEASVDAFRYGKEKVARDLNLPQALEVEPERLSEVASSEDEPASADP